MIGGLKDRYRTAIVNILRTNDRVERAVLYGSRAIDRFTPGSDVDIALFGQSLTITDQAQLAALMEALYVPQRVDLLLYDRLIDANLRRHIDRDGVELYRRSSD